MPTFVRDSRHFMPTFGCDEGYDEEYKTQFTAKLRDYRMEVPRDQLVWLILYLVIEQTKEQTQLLYNLQAALPIISRPRRSQAPPVSLSKQQIHKIDSSFGVYSQYRDIQTAQGNQYQKTDEGAGGRNRNGEKKKEEGG